METNETKKAIPQISVDSQVIIANLRAMKKGDVIGYSDLSKLISSDVTTKSRYALNTARRRVLMDDGMVFEAVRGVGIKRMDDTGIISIGEQSERRLHRLSRNAMRKLSCADMDNLNNDQKLEVATHSSVIGAIAVITKPSKIRLIKAAVQQSEKQLPVNKSLEIFKT